jgi:MFS family permease
MAVTDEQKTPLDSLPRVYAKLAIWQRIKASKLALLQGFVVAILSSGIIILSVYGSEFLSKNSGNIQGLTYSVWDIVLFAATTLAGLITAIGLPVLWGRKGGYKRVLGAISFEVFLVAVALMVTAFVLNRQSTTSPPPPPGTVLPCIGVYGGVCQGVDT